ncbi:L,D-transpeptidase [Pseudonocardia hispaniensis]|uniref:L,D-transpeptidase n=1 Tax=Pseudonocardia hispaniensis TaxID=904933 RepID=A0ABW1IZJ9_9PSEU
MRAGRMLGLIAVIAAAGLLGGGAAGDLAPSAAAARPAPNGAAPGPAQAPPVTSAAAPSSTPPPAASSAPAAHPASTAPPAFTRAGRAPAASNPAPAAGFPCRPTARACVDLSAKRAWLIRDGVVIHGPVPITHGRPGWRTPPGTFRVTFTNKHHRSSLFDNAPMPYSVFFNGGIAFHEGSLAEQSHGCIHLTRSAAQAFFGSLRPGDLVQVVR